MKNWMKNWIGPILLSIFAIGISILLAERFPISPVILLRILLGMVSVISIIIVLTVYKILRKRTRRMEGGEMSQQGEDGWYPECEICKCGHLDKVVCMDCYKKMNENYIHKDRLSVERLMNIIEKKAVAPNKDNIIPSFIWNCTLKDLATELSKELSK